MRSYHLTTVRDGNMLYVVVVFADGSKRIIGAFELPQDNQWRLDVEFCDSIVDAYKQRYRKIIWKGDVIEMSAVIHVNGKEVPESIVVVDTATGKGQFSSMDSPWIDLDLNKLVIEINIYGDISL